MLLFAAAFLLLQALLLPVAFLVLLLGQHAAPLFCDISTAVFAAVAICFCFRFFNFCCCFSSAYCRFFLLLQALLHLLAVTLLPFLTSLLLLLAFLVHLFLLLLLLLPMLLLLLLLLLASGCNSSWLIACPELPQQQLQ